MYIIIQSSFSFKINNDIMFRNIKGYYAELVKFNITKI